MSETLSPQQDENLSLPESLLDEGKQEIQDLIRNVRSTELYQSSVERRRENAKKVSGEEVTDEELQDVMEGTDDPYKIETGAPDFKQAFWDYVVDYENKKGELPTYYDEKKYPQMVRMEYGAYKLKAQRLLKMHEGVYTQEEIHQRDKEKSDTHDRIATELVKEGYVPSHLWGRLLARLWLVGDEFDDINSAREMDALRRLRRLEDGGTETRFMEKPGS